MDRTGPQADMELKGSVEMTAGFVRWDNQELKEIWVMRVVQVGGCV